MDAILITKNWITRVVIGCNFCPFASREVNRDTVHYHVEEGNDREKILLALMEKCRRMDDDRSIETTLLILPSAVPDFLDFLDLLDLANELLAMHDYEGVYQLASFHPLYRFAGAPGDDPANYTNRSPFPMLQLLREESVEKALEHYPNPEEIPERNIRFARERGLAGMKRLMDGIGN